VNVATVVIAAAAVVVAVVALLSDRWFRRRDGLEALLERFEAARFHTRMWRVEQRSRPAGGSSWTIEPFDVSQSNEPVVRRALAQDWEHEDATMHELYFYALRVHAWLSPAWWRWDRGRVRLLNATFGYSLLVTLLDHRVIACRLASPSQTAKYYPTQYGCLDPVYRDLVDRLWKDMRRREDTPPGEIRDALGERYRSSEAHLASL
jgi:hypothetical protein